MLAFLFWGGMLMFWGTVFWSAGRFDCLCFGTLGLFWMLFFGALVFWSDSVPCLLPGCPLLTTTGLSGLVQLQELEELELTNCPGATPELFKYFSQHLPCCMVIE